MAVQAPAGGLHPGDFLVVVHDFNARGPDELTLRRGDKIELVELDDGFGDGWYLGKVVKTGITGLFPGVYTTVAPKIHLPQHTDASESRAQRDPQSVDGNLPVSVNAPVSSQKSADTTPQASRHASASDIQSPTTPLAPAPPSPKQQLRSTSSPLPAPPMATEIQQSIKQSIDNHLGGQDSPVMNETLSVIDEHITNLSTPRHSLAAQDSKPVTDSGSEYSSHVDHRLSYINGHETDEEEENQPTEEEVRRWNHTETAKHLRDLGVETKHADIFEEQEISGDVLLDMDQDFIFMKEFDFGVMGRRLKTWHKVKAFQEEIKGLKQPPRGSVSGYPNPADERSVSRAGHTGTFLPRIPSLSERSVTGRPSRGSVSSIQHPRVLHNSVHSNTSSPRTPQTPPYGIGTQRRPSAASIREINHSRRHSSIDTTGRSIGPSDISPYPYHQKHGSFDKSWSMIGGSQHQPLRPGTSLGTAPDIVPPHHIFRGAETNEADSGISMVDRFDDLDRGYFSGPEGDPLKGRRVLKKRSAAGLHSKQPSYDDDSLKISPMSKRHTRINSADSIRETANHVSAASKAYHSAPKGRFRSLSTRITDRPGQTSTAATPERHAQGGILTSFAPFASKTDPETSGRSSPMPLQQIKNAAPKFRRAMGLRAMTDAVGKGIDTAVASASSSKENDPSSARTGSTTPSATSKSSERHSTDGSGKTTETGALLPRPKTVKAGPKSKKHTSAYTQGLEKKTPQEQISGCDYSGWMKKKSSNLMTTWKPRLFVLRGRRLSYYYSENDTEERGLIDITAHRVLRADNDPIIALHATITGSTVSSTAPSNSESASPKAPSQPQLKGEADGPFFFKLVPPKMGASRTVQFTKPAVHYFQVDTVKQGRLWMAALMKATIERNMDFPPEMSNKQKTISLKQARLMNQRPPALMNIESNDVVKEDRKEEEESEEKPEERPEEKLEEEPEKKLEEKLEDKDKEGLKIQGLDVDRTSTGSEPAETTSYKLVGGLEVDTGPTSLLPDDMAERND
ncbi:polarized growth protein [Aspergillus sclerotialis]|uniref:Polarized growth protein n=1 Tax=Aspergillus sclerotialis TaxID=2070753 RepID=A0A3A2Z5U4_9EURO|nr:polarized growth protein [Aspergillus sclerotialis]